MELHQVHQDSQDHQAHKVHPAHQEKMVNQDLKVRLDRRVTKATKDPTEFQDHQVAPDLAVPQDNRAHAITAQLRALDLDMQRKSENR